MNLDNDSRVIWEFTLGIPIISNSNSNSNSNINSNSNSNSKHKSFENKI